MLATEATPGFLSVGQPAARAIAERAGHSGRLGRTFLVAGPRGAGKGAFVDDLLALLFCQASDRAGRPCNVCAGCRQARRRSHPDLVIGSPERWRELKGTGESIVAAARRWLAQGAGAPIAGERRVILLEGVDRAGEPIQNALLKALEEPSDRHVYVLVADQPSRLLPTIRSRTQLLRIGPVARADLAAWLMDAEGLPRDQAHALARLSGGMLGRAVSYARDPESVAWRRRTQAELLGLLSRGRADRFGSARELLDEATRRAQPSDAEDGEVGEDGEPIRTPTALQRVAATAIVAAWIDLARDLMVAAAGRPEAAPGTEVLPDLQDVARQLRPSDLATFLTFMERIHEGLAQSASPRLALDAAMLAWPTVAA
jgi:DNA polymerase-3 subunit delta'